MTTAYEAAMRAIEGMACRARRVDRERRLEAEAVAKDLPISAERARQLLDTLGSRETVVALVEREMADERRYA